MTRWRCDGSRRRRSTPIRRCRCASRASAAGDADAARELTHWIDPANGLATARHLRIGAARSELGFDPAKPVLDPCSWDQRVELARGGNVDFAWLPLETAHLRRAARADDAEARRILIDEGLALESLIETNGPDWLETRQKALAQDDVALLWSSLDEAPVVWREKALFFMRPDEADGNRTEVASQIGAIALRLARETEVPAGRSRRSLLPLLEIGFTGGDGASFEGLVALSCELARHPEPSVAADAGRVRKPEDLALDLCRRALDQDVANCVYLEQRVRKYCGDGPGWNELLRSKDLYVDAQDAPSSLLLFLRENVERASLNLRMLGLVKDDLPFFEYSLDTELGRAGELLHDRVKRFADPLAIRTLATLGYSPADADELFAP